MSTGLVGRALKLKYAQFSFLKSSNKKRKMVSQLLSIDVFAVQRKGFQNSRLSKMKRRLLASVHNSQKKYFFFVKNVAFSYQSFSHKDKIMVVLNSSFISFIHQARIAIPMIFFLIMNTSTLQFAGEIS